MPQTDDYLTGPTFDFEERAALKAFGFRFDSVEGHEAAEIEGRMRVDIIPPRRGEEFTVNVILPGGVQLVAHTPRREIVWADAYARHV